MPAGRPSGMLEIMSHPHPPAGGHGHRHHDEPRTSLAARARPLLRPHAHDAADQVDAVMEASSGGTRALWTSLAVLPPAPLIQATGGARPRPAAVLGATQ